MAFPVSDGIYLRPKNGIVGTMSHYSMGRRATHTRMQAKPDWRMGHKPHSWRVARSGKRRLTHAAYGGTDGRLSGMKAPTR